MTPLALAAAVVVGVLEDVLVDVDVLDEVFVLVEVLVDVRVFSVP